jgi:CDGSH iron-sulfur domain-containing protein 3
MTLFLSYFWAANIKGFSYTSTFYLVKISVISLLIISYLYQKTKTKWKNYQKLHKNHLILQTRKAFCTCGISSKNPYYDGSHKGTGFSYEIVILEEDKKVAWCGCKHSSKGTFSDGSNRTFNLLSN